MEQNPRILTNTFSQAIARALVVFVSLLTTFFLTRILGATGYGNYVFISSFVLIFVGLTDLGTTIVGVRESSIDKTQARNIFGNIFSLRLFLSLFLFLFFNLLILFLPQFSGLHPSAFIASFVLPFLILRTTSMAILQTFLRLDLASLSEGFASIVFLFFLLVFYRVFQTISLPALMLFWSLSALLSGFLALIFSARYLPLQLAWNKDLLKKIFKEAAPLGIYLLIYSVYDRGIDSFFLKTFKGSEAVGFYGLAYKIHGNLILGAAFLMNSLFPVLSSLKQNDNVLRKTFNKAFTVLLLGGCLIVFGVFIFSPLVVFLIAGKNFFPSILALRILLGATLFSFLNHLTGYYLVVLGEQRKLLQFSLISLVFNLVFNFIFIPRFSFVAAAAITVFTEGILFLLTINFLRRRFDLEYNLKVLRENLKSLARNKANYFIQV